MRYKITLPNNNVVKYIDETDEKYLEGLRSRGYTVERELNVCTACEG